MRVERSLWAQSDADNANALGAALGYGKIRNQWSRWNGSRWGASDMDGWTREGESSGRKTNQIERDKRQRERVSEGPSESMEAMG